MEQILSTQAIEVQRTIQGATQVVTQTQCEIHGLSNMARKVEYTAQMTTAKVERQAKEIAQQVQMQKE